MTAYPLTRAKDLLTRRPDAVVGHLASGRGPTHPAEAFAAGAGWDPREDDGEYVSTAMAQVGRQ
jgi:hypothetical protein